MKGRAGAGNGLGCWGRLVLVLLVLLVGEGALQILFQYQRRCPPVSGVVVDRDTGRPIAGAFVTRQMLGMSRNLLYYLGGSGGPTPLLPFAGVLTNPEGRFSFPADRTVMKVSESGDPFIYVYGPDIRQAIRLVVYSPEYIPVRSQEKGFDWKKEEWLSLDQEHTHDMRNPKWKVVGPTGFSVTRSGSLWTGYQYRIEMIKAVTEAQWEEKCHETWLLNSLYIPKSISDEWLLNDLTGYLERWPDTPYEKARLPMLLGGYAKADYQHNEWVLDCAKLRAAELADQKIFLQKFEFLGKWLRAKMAKERLTPVDRLPSGSSPKTHAERLLVNYADWSRYESEVQECMGGGK